MTEEIQDYDQQISELLYSLKTIVHDEIPNLQGKIRNEKIEFVHGRANRLKQLLHSFKVELREVSRVDARPYEEKAKEYEREIGSLTSELAAVKEANGGKHVDELSTGQIIVEARKVQEESMASTQRSKRILEETINVGTETSKTLKSQTEQLERIDKQVDVVQSNLKKAEKQLRVFMRRMATDKLIMTFVCLIFLGIIAIIIVAIVNKSTGNTGPGTINTVIPWHYTPTPTPTPH